MRSTPSKSSAKITTIPNGTVVSAAQYDDEWSKVKYGGKEGYAMSEYLVFGELDLNDEAITLVSEIEQRLARLKKILQS